MNQEKIGKFISICRKEKGLTQEQLGIILNVTDKAISKWENGRCLPDTSLLIPLSNALDISLNELLSGEKILEEKINEKCEENIVKTIEYTNTKINQKNKIIRKLIITFIILIFTLVSLFIIDINRMRNNKPVFFSTWGFSYVAPIDLVEEKIGRAVEEYLIVENTSKYHEDSHTFVSMQTYLIEEKKDEIILYTWALVKTYYEENGEIIEDSGSSIPYKFTLIKENDEYIVIDYQIPKDGSYYEESMKELFPRSVLRKINKVHTDGTIERLSFDIDNQVENYYNK